MNKLVLFSFVALTVSGLASAQEPLQPTDTLTAPKLISLEQALQIAVSENASVKVADMEVERSGYERKGTYSSLLPQVNGTANYQRTIKKQVMYMDFDMSSLGEVPDPVLKARRVLVNPGLPVADFRPAAASRWAVGTPGLPECPHLCLL